MLSAKIYFCGRLCYPGSDKAGNLPCPIDQASRRDVTAIQPCVNEALSVLNSVTNRGFKRRVCKGRWWTSGEQMGDAMFSHADHHDPVHMVLRTNRTVVLALFWAALAACVVSSMVYDVADWISAW